MECIHGLDDGQCDICFPTVRPEPERTPRVRSRPAGQSRPSAARPGSGRGSAVPDITRERVYHLTHLSNLAGVIAADGLLASAFLGPGDPTVDISTAAARDARRGIPAGTAGARVADYVPFFLSPDADAWRSIREGTADPRIAAGDRGPSEFVLLVSSLGRLGDYVLADGDAAHPLTRFHDGSTDAAKRAVRALVTEGETGRLVAAEVLVPEVVPLDRIDLIAVPNDRGRAAVRAAIDRAGVTARVAIHPPWFQRD